MDLIKTVDSKYFILENIYLIFVADNLSMYVYIGKQIILCL